MLILMRSRRSSNALIAHIPVHRQILKGTALGLGDEQRSEDTSKHKRREDLHDVVEPRAGVVGCGLSADTKGRDGALSDDRADLARGGGDAMGGGAVACGETFAGNDECGGVGTP
jgi:hypothetical protein